MTSLESDYLQLWRELVLKYGKKPLSALENKALALVLSTKSFKRVWLDASFQEELEMLAEPFENMSLPEVTQQLNDLQTDFIRNRYIEIINENPHDTAIQNPRNITIEWKIAAVESLGVTTSDSMNNLLPTGQTLRELIADLYQLYLVEYRAFRKNREHPIFCLVAAENLDTDMIKLPQRPAGSRKDHGCLALFVAFFLLSSYIIVSVLSP